MRYILLAYCIYVIVGAGALKIIGYMIKQAYDKIVRWQ
jgi:hypothetical protein